MTDNSISNVVGAVFGAGSKAVTASDRIDTIDVTVRGVQMAVPVAIDANGKTAVLEEVLEVARNHAAEMKPERRQRYDFHDFASLVAWARRFTKPHATAWLTPPGLSTVGRVVVVIDDMDPSGDIGAHQELRGQLDIQLHDRLKTWLMNAGKWFPAEAFCTFVDEASDELMTADLLTMIGNIEVKSEQTWKRTVDGNGKIKLQVEDQSGPATTIPREFQLMLPVTSMDSQANAMQFAASLFSKVEKGHISFKYVLTDVQPQLLAATRVNAATLGSVLAPERVYLGSAPS